MVRARTGHLLTLLRTSQSQIMQLLAACVRERIDGVACVSFPTSSNLQIFPGLCADVTSSTVFLLFC
jgi:hypothetical protein